MPYRGHVENGVIVLDSPCSIPEGTAVSVEVLSPQHVAAQDRPPLWGLLADDAELLDRVVADALKDRAERRWRHTDG
jgi:hypothetical protein